MTANKIPIHCKYDKLVNLKDLKPNPENPNWHPDEQIELLAKIIQSNGWRDRIVVSNLSGMIVKGHGRYRGAQLAGFEVAPVEYQDYASQGDEVRDLIADNKIAELSEIDTEAARQLIAGLEKYESETIELSDFGFTADEIENLFYADSRDDSADDEVPEVDEKDVVTKPGDLYLLGRHRLLCGDATVKADVERLMDGKKADMVFTDPPYHMFLDTDFSSMIGIGRGKKYKKIRGDGDDFLPDLILKPLDFFSYCKEIFMWGADYYAELLPNRNKGSWIVWDKMQSGEGVNDKYDKMFGSNFELCWSKARHKRALARVLWKGIFGLSDEPERKRLHPAQKPIKLVEWFFSTIPAVKNKNLIVDIFLGCGTTLIASEKTNRICYGMEIEPYDCDVIVKRWQDYTGQKATLEK